MSCRFLSRFLLHTLVCGALCVHPAIAENTHKPTPSFLGAIGLNLIPTARMDESGTARVGVSHLDPFIHGFAGFQATDRLYVQIRQTAETSSLTDDPDHVLPAVDMKWRIAQENRYTPEIAIGLNSAFGHRRTAAEYIALTKRWNNFDVTAGMGWGRMGSAGHIKNPLAHLSNHFDGARDLSSQDPHTAHDWFTGEDAGLFGGVEYDLPWDDLSFKAEYSADRFVDETRSITGFQKPAPWSASLNYSPFDFMSVGVGMAGTDKLMLRLSLGGNVTNYNGRAREFYPASTGTETTPSPHMFLTPVFGTPTQDRSELLINAHEPTARQIGRAFKTMSHFGAAEIESLEIHTIALGLRGPDISVSRKDIDADKTHTISPEEIWKDANIKSTRRTTPIPTKTPWDFWVTPDMRLSLSEEDSAYLYRSSILFNEQKQWAQGVITGTSWRLNIMDNLSRLSYVRKNIPLSIRNNVDDFTSPLITLNHAHVSHLDTIFTDVHMLNMAGYLEDMYAGMGTEILWRPFGKTYAIGAEAYQTFKRDADSTLNLQLTDQTSLNAKLNFFYEIPETDYTFFAEGGRFLAGDYGGTLGISRRFDNGAKVRAYISASNVNDADVFGETLPIIAGLTFTFPIGNVPYMPTGSQARVSLEPFGRDTAQNVQKPLNLYDVSEPVSYRHLARGWGELLN